MKSTKDLAKELGLLCKRTRQLDDDLEKKIRRSAQIFDYLVVIDFESTCWQGTKHNSQEIIEFPAVLLNTRSGEIEAEFHQYVQPQENPILSDFCKQLTGISQDQVDNGIPLSVCLKQLARWLSSLTEKFSIVYNSTSTNVEQHPCTFTTWSDWDLGTCLHYECRRKQLRKPLQLNSWIDLRATYRTFYGRKPHGLNGALQEVGITFEGREHSGLHDARNTARLAWQMISDGCVMQITKSLQTTDSSSSGTSKSTAVKVCESIPERHTSHLTTHNNSSAVTVQYSVCQAQSENNDCGRHSMVLRKCNVDESRGKTNQQFTVDDVVTRENGHTTHVTNLVTDHLLSYGFDAADWLDDSFTDEHSCADAAKPLSSQVTSKDSKSTKSRFKVYEDHDGSAQQNAVSHTSRNSNRKVLCDRTNVVHRSLQMSAKKTSPVTKRTTENDKTYGVCHIQRAAVIDQRNSANDSVKLACEQVGPHVDVCMSEASSKICNESSRGSVTSSVSAAVTITRLSAANTVVTASCQRSSSVLSSVATLTSSSVVFSSCITAAVGIRMSVPSSVTFESPVSSVTICSSARFSESVKCQPVGSIQSSFASCSAVPKLFPSSIKTPQNQSSVRSSCNTPGMMVTPCNQPVQNSTMRPTPPMCSCGCRAKRKFVQSPGQNMGRPFYCCGASKRTPKNGCNFFKWENSPSLTPFAHSSEVTPLSTKQLLSMHTRDRSKNFNTPFSNHTPLSNHTRQATGSRILVPPSFR